MPPPPAGDSENPKTQSLTIGDTNDDTETKSIESKEESKPEDLHVKADIESSDPASAMDQDVKSPESDAKQ